MNLINDRDKRMHFVQGETYSTGKDEKSSYKIRAEVQMIYNPTNKSWEKGQASFKILAEPKKETEEGRQLKKLISDFNHSTF